MSIRARYIGPEGASFERVGLAFEALGFNKPHTEEGGNGAYASNIAAQYARDMSELAALAVIRWGLRNTRAYFNSISPNEYTLDEIVGMNEA